MYLKLSQKFEKNIIILIINKIIIKYFVNI